MLPPPESIILEQLIKIEDRREVFAILQFDNDFHWHREAWSSEGQRGGIYEHRHAEVDLDEKIDEFIKDWVRDIGGLPTVSAITIKWSPCKECSQRYLQEVKKKLATKGIKENYLYYLVRYGGLGEENALEGISIAGSHFTEVQVYSDVPERKNDWRDISKSYRYELGL